MKHRESENVQKFEIKFVKKDSQVSVSSMSVEETEKIGIETALLAKY